MVTLRTQHAGERTYREVIWMNGTEIYSRFSSRLPQTVVCVVYPAGWRCLTLSADIDSAVDRAITRLGRSKCRRNGKVLTTRTLRNLRPRDAATKVGLMVRADSVKVELLSQCEHVISSVFDKILLSSHRGFLNRNHWFISKWDAPTLGLTDVQPPYAVLTLWIHTVLLLYCDISVLPCNHLTTELSIFIPRKQSCVLLRITFYNLSSAPSGVTFVWHQVWWQDRLLFSVTDRRGMQTEASVRAGWSQFGWYCCHHSDTNRAVDSWTELWNANYNGCSLGVLFYSPVVRCCWLHRVITKRSFCIFL